MLLKKHSHNVSINLKNNYISYCSFIAFQAPHERKISTEHPIRFVRPPVQNTGSDPLNRKSYFTDEVHNSPISSRRPLPPPPKGNSPAFRKHWSPILTPTRVIEKEAAKQESRKLQSEETTRSQKTDINNPSLQELIAKQAAKLRADSAELQRRYPVGSYEATDSFNPPTISWYDDTVINQTTSSYVTKPFARDDNVLNQWINPGPPYKSTIILYIIVTIINNLQISNKKLVRL